MKWITLIFIASVVVVCFADDAIIEKKVEYCGPASCIESNKCPETKKLLSIPCQTKGDVCCSEINPDHRHRCRHFGGECMKSCGVVVQQLTADDCEDGKICCVLVN